MKKLFLISLLISGCTTQTSHGPCVGFMDIKEDNKVYELSYFNIALAVVLSETIFVPLIVAAKQLECPTKDKE